MYTLKIVTILGARPQFVKAATVSRVIAALNAGRAKVVEEVLLHTGQHFDENMSAVFFSELAIPEPKYNLTIRESNHGAMTGKMLAGIEQVLLDERPDFVLVYGDTNSTLAGALAAAKLHIPVAHIEAGLRSFNRKMPEEINRVMTDHLSSKLYCPTTASTRNLAREGVVDGVIQVGDVMHDASIYFRELALEQSTILERMGLAPGGYVLATCHRAENTDDATNLEQILGALNLIAEEMPVVLPLHPRTRKLMDKFDLAGRAGRIKFTEPLSFFDMVRLEISASAIITDSGGVQKEAFFYGVPCITLRDETEWVETVESGWNKLCGADAECILDVWGGLKKSPPNSDRGSPFGSGNAAQKIMADLMETI